MSTLVEVKNLSIAFGGVKAVQNVSFDIPQGMILGLIGPNGSGKSTCVNMISGVCKPDNGDIIYDGVKLTDKMSVAQRSVMGIGRTFQSPKPFANLSVYENIYIASLVKNSRKQAAEKTDYVLDLIGLSHLAHTRSSKLSIEKRKWLDLGRVLATDPKLLMMDEVMAGLNPSEMQDSLELVKKINREGITVLFIEHVMRAVLAICHETLVLDEGRLLCRGEPAEVLRRQDVIEAYIGKGASDYA